MKRNGHGGRVFWGALAIGTLGAWELKLTPAGWILDADAEIARYWCDPRPALLRVELVKLVPSPTKRGTDDPPLVPTTTTCYGAPARIRPHDLLLKDIKDEPPELVTEPHGAR